MSLKVSAFTPIVDKDAHRLFLPASTACTNIKIKKDAKHVFKNFEISKTSLKFLIFLDRISPYLNKHNNLRKACMYIGEKIFRCTNKI